MLGPGTVLGVAVCSLVLGVEVLLLVYGSHRVIFLGSEWLRKGWLTNWRELEKIT